MNLTNFSYTTYKNLLRALLKSRVNLCFGDFFIKKHHKENFLILRHDVDFSPEAALQMAEIEAEIGIKATYFVLFSSIFYNLLNEKYIAFPRRLVKMGHEVGLHYDLRALELTGAKNISKIILQENDILTKLAGAEVKSIAMHNPSLSGIDSIQKTKFVNAYDANYTKNIAYFSDSCGAWRDSLVMHLKKNNFPRQMQLLIHPIFWGTTSLSRWEILGRFIQNKKRSLSNSAREIRNMWLKHAGLIEHEKRNSARR
jgi:peptidoglycan/xylan/chitin deacetylase (PgdA/CDA1 family)